MAKKIISMVLIKVHADFAAHIPPTLILRYW